MGSKACLYLNCELFGRRVCCKINEKDKVVLLESLDKLTEQLSDDTTILSYWLSFERLWRTGAGRTKIVWEPMMGFERASDCPNRRVTSRTVADARASVCDWYRPSSACKRRRNPPPIRTSDASTVARRWAGLETGNTGGTDREKAKATEEGPLKGPRWEKGTVGTVQWCPQRRVGTNGADVGGDRKPDRSEANSRIANRVAKRECADERISPETELRRNNNCTRTDLQDEDESGNIEAHSPDNEEGKGCTLLMKPLVDCYEEGTGSKREEVLGKGVKRKGNTGNGYRGQNYGDGKHGERYPLETVTNSEQLEKSGDEDQECLMR
ncbi:hypothetical protein CALCODRAFT_505485 [Calocera cornea HHB12733]|uniref:Uncharacterized protein n=1 Tax=Calocera cornea HHB12733 TaxID=1353952 RepID=A0A165K676_9BASI|nr:hypothetical protein CALCODRAFT_505485 [Calocera cornea HHB12733]